MNTLVTLLVRKRRLFELLAAQGMLANQQVTFLTDGADDVRDLPLYLNPQAEHLLDWFHVTMRLTVLPSSPRACAHPHRRRPPTAPPPSWHGSNGSAGTATSSGRCRPSKTSSSTTTSPTSSAAGTPASPTPSKAR